MRTRRKDEPVFMIGVAAQLCGMHPQTLRLYERLGLVQPRRQNGRNRLYSEVDIERLLQIQRLTQDMGVNLAGVEVILDLLERIQKIQEESEHRMQELKVFYIAEIERLRRKP